MKYLRLYIILFIGFYSCSEPSCNCDLLFKDKDSLVNISASKNPEIQKLVAKKYLIQMKYDDLVLKNDTPNYEIKTNLQLDSMNTSEQISYYEKQLKVNEFKKKLIGLKVEEQKTELELHRIIRYSTNQTEELKIIPYTGTCFKLGAKNEVYYEAEYENGKLVSEEWIE